MNIVPENRLLSVRFSYYILVTNILALIMTIYFNGVYNPSISRGLTLKSDDNRCIPRDEAAFQAYVTPEDSVIQKMASQISCIEDAYVMAIQWVYVSENKLNGQNDQWSSPREFITASPSHINNPVPGMVAGDCEEQANTLAAIIRAAGIPPEEVRVALGLCAVDSKEKGHVWVEVYVYDMWLILDPCSGPYWDDKTGTLVKRKGLPLDYYLSHKYPVQQVMIYYNDEFYFEQGGSNDNLPLQWKQDSKRIDPMMISGIE
ncbi:MAG: transglutaminase domain-containing protein [Dehalococcoidales bacterium]|nr:MAG: transglutaminase domain-containing protein [Dehalococcoidales bacterium]